MDGSPYQAPLIGHEAPATLFLEATRAQRIHHAWLLTGPKGIGKAHFAWQAAGHLLSQASEQSALLGPPEPLSTLQEASKNGAFGQMLAGSHPDFRSLTPDPSKAKAQISVEQVRHMASMFITTAGMGGWRVAIIDAAEDMNRNAANAILKLLEEPPAKCLFLLISHAPGRLLPTIRSRCRSLAFKPLTLSATHALLQSLRPDAEDAEIASVLPLCVGSPGRAIELLDGNAGDYLLAIDQIFSALPQLNQQSVLGIADLVGDRSSKGPFEVVWDLIDERLCTAAKFAMTTEQDEAWIHALPADKWLSLQETMAPRKAKTLGLNLSPRHVTLSFFADLHQMLEQAR